MYRVQGTEYRVPYTTLKDTTPYFEGVWGYVSCEAFVGNQYNANFTIKFLKFAQNTGRGIISQKFVDLKDNYQENEVFKKIKDLDKHYGCAKKCFTR